MNAAINLNETNNIRFNQAECSIKYQAIFAGNGHRHWRRQRRRSHFNRNGKTAVITSAI